MKSLKPQRITTFSLLCIIHRKTNYVFFIGKLTFLFFKFNLSKKVLAFNLTMENVPCQTVKKVIWILIGPGLYKFFMKWTSISVVLEQKKITTIAENAWYVDCSKKTMTVKMIAKDTWRSSQMSWGSRFIFH